MQQVLPSVLHLRLVPEISSRAQMLNSQKYFDSFQVFLVCTKILNLHFRSISIHTLHFGHFRAVCHRLHILRCVCGGAESIPAQSLLALATAQASGSSLKEFDQIMIKSTQKPLEDSEDPAS